MRSRTLLVPLAGLASAAIALAAAFTAVAGESRDRSDPLDREIRRWSALLRENASNDETWLQIKKGSEPLMAGADRALRDGRRLLALQRLASARSFLAASVYVAGRPASQLRDFPGLESEWTRVGRELGASREKPDPGALSGVSLAAARALGEAALSQVRVYYDSSLVYGRSTIPREGFFYLGLAQAQNEFVAFCRTLPAPSRREPPPVRGLERELDSLAGELLDAYRPPAAIDRHGEFIAASSALKEARELDAAGFRYGALLRYLQAAQRVSLVRRTPPAVTAEALAARLRELDARLSAGGYDDSIGRSFLEAAQAEVAEAAPGAVPAAAAAIAGDVLPRYFAALGAPPPDVPKPSPLVTVTLVRWPYT